MPLPQGCVAECPACPHRELSREESLKRKSEFLMRVLAQPIENICSAPETNRWHYREKTLLHAKQVGGRWQFGMILGRERLFIPIPDCPVHSQRVNGVLRVLSETLPLENFPLSFVSVSGGLVTLVLKAKEISTTSRQLLLALCPALAESGATGLHLNLHPSAGNRVFSSKGWLHLWGEKEESCGETFSGPASFQQLIPSLHRAALSRAFDFLAPSPRSMGLDLFCGNGSSLALWKRAGGPFLGVEIAGESQRIAARVFGERNVLRGSVEDRLPQMEAALTAHCGTAGGELLVFTNPSRTGMGEEVSTWLAQVAKPQRIAYLSCNPLSLRDDLSILTESGYRVFAIVPYDFFPQTAKVESLVMVDQERPMRA